jgi:hypothetical protein
MTRGQNSGAVKKSAGGWLDAFAALADFGLAAVMGGGGVFVDFDVFGVGTPHLFLPEGWSEFITRKKARTHLQEPRAGPLKKRKPRRGRPSRAPASFAEVNQYNMRGRGSSTGVDG